MTSIVENIKIIGGLTSHSNGFYAKQQKSAQMAARFEHCDENISKLLEINGNHLIFKAYLQERNIQNPAKAEELASVVRKFYVEVRPNLNPFCVFRALEIF